VTVITEAPESLDWVTFSEEDDETCEARGRTCGLEAVVIAYYARQCRCFPSQQRLCAAHRDRTIASAQLSWPQTGVFYCRACGRLLRLLRIEPIR
jgi:hypothetical protein